jgi:hypothetical protein
MKRSSLALALTFSAILSVFATPAVAAPAPAPETKSFCKWVPQVVGIEIYTDISKPQCVDIIDLINDIMTKLEGNLDGRYYEKTFVIKKRKDTFVASLVRLSTDYRYTVGFIFVKIKGGETKIFFAGDGELKIQSSASPSGVGVKTIKDLEGLLRQMKLQQIR